MNNQKPEPRAIGDGASLDLHSMFFTVQGEGPFAGHRAIFVRLAGCNLQCPGCDTEYTEGREAWLTRHIVLAVSQLAVDNNAPCCLVVITGGEPLRQPIGQLVIALRELGHPVQIESNGVLSPDPLLAPFLETANGQDLCLVVSPKTSRINTLTAACANVFKYVLDADEVAEDGLPIRALGHPASTGVARPPRDFAGRIYVNPYDSGDPVLNQRNLEAAAASAKAHGYVLGVQLHKLVNLP